jgi:putative ABC transport system permease protein
MRVLWRLAIRELRNHWRFSLFFILNLASGLVGLVLISTLLESVRISLDSRSQALLGADLSISIRRLLSDAESEKIRKVLPAGTQVTSVVDFFSMLEQAEESRLVQVRAVGDGYPFYGGLKLKGAGNVQGSEAVLNSQSVWIESDTVDDFGLKAGSSVSIGGLQFTFTDAVTEDSTQGMMTLAAAPRVLIGKRWLSDEYLESRGTTLRYSWLYRLPLGADAEKIKLELSKAVDEPSVRIQTHRESSEGLARLLNYFSDYLALVSLASLSLAALGVVYQFRRYFLSRAKSVAIFLSLGATPARALVLLGMQILILAFLGSLLSLVLTLLAMPAFAEALAPFSVVPIEVRMDWWVALRAVATGVGLSVLLCLPQLAAIRRFNASALFREQTRFQSTGGSVVWYLPAAIAYAGLCVVYSNSFWIAAFFLLGLALSALLLTSLPWAILSLLARRSSSWRLEAKLAVLHLRRNPASTLLVSVCLGLVTLLGSLLPQIRSSVQEEIQGPASENRPSFFLLDIQPDQLEPLNALLKSKQVELAQPSALIRGRLVSVNGSRASRVEAGGNFVTREEEQEAAFRNRGFNLSFRQELSASETLLSGRVFSGAWDPQSGNLPEVSVETRFAKRLGWKLGDELAFDIAGEEYKAKIVNIRSVRWASFQPNFFVVFQKGVLEAAPAVYIGTVPKLDRQIARDLAREISKRFANISLIPVEKVLERLYSLSQQMIAALLLTTLWVVLASVLTLYSISRYEAYSRLGDMNLLKVLGATQRTVRKVFLWETGLVAVICATMGALAGSATSYVLMRFGLEGSWKADWVAIALSIGATVAWMYVQTVATSARIWRSRPRDLFGL